MQLLDRLLLDRLHRHRADLGTARDLNQRTWWPCAPSVRELCAGQPRAALNPVLAIRHRQFKAALCQVDAHGRSINDGLLLPEA